MADKQVNENMVGFPVPIWEQGIPQSGDFLPSSGLWGTRGKYPLNRQETKSNRQENKSNLDVPPSPGSDISILVTSGGRFSFGAKTYGLELILQYSFPHKPECNPWCPRCAYITSRYVSTYFLLLFSSLPMHALSHHLPAQQRELGAPECGKKLERMEQFSKLWQKQNGHHGNYNYILF